MDTVRRGLGVWRQIERTQTAPMNARTYLEVLDRKYGGVQHEYLVFLLFAIFEGDEMYVCGGVMESD